jgi:uncharacterized membrane protein
MFTKNLGKKDGATMKFRKKKFSFQVKATVTILFLSGVEMMIHLDKSESISRRP